MAYFQRDQSLYKETEFKFNESLIFFSSILVEKVAYVGPLPLPWDYGQSKMIKTNSLAWLFFSLTKVHLRLACSVICVNQNSVLANQGAAITLEEISPRYYLF